jgi:hypothetical protein
VEVRVFVPQGLSIETMTPRSLRVRISKP